jgi:hypothetical protein
MPAIQRISDRVCLADVVAFDRDDKPVVVVAADERPLYPQSIGFNLEVLQAIRKDIPFAILAYAEEMTIYRKHRTRSLEPVATIPTREIIRFYAPESVEGRLFSRFIAAMIDVWLRDFMWHWKSPTPPYSETMAALGLVERLENGWSKARVRLACLPVRGDQLPTELRDREESGNGRHPLEPAPVPPADHA